MFLWRCLRYRCLFYYDVIMPTFQRYRPHYIFFLFCCLSFLFTIHECHTFSLSMFTTQDSVKLSLKTPNFVKKNRTENNDSARFWWVWNDYDANFHDSCCCNSFWLAKRFGGSSIALVYFDGLILFVPRSDNVKKKTNQRCLSAHHFLYIFVYFLNIWHILYI